MSNAEINPTVSTPPLTGVAGEIPMLAHFLFVVDQVQIGAFNEVSGLEMRAETVSYNEGGENGFVHQLPGRMTWPNVTLKQGVINNDNLFAWVGKTSGSGFAGAGNKVSRCTGSIYLMSMDGAHYIRRWDLSGVMPIRWTGPRFALSSNEQAVEELELVHNGFTSSSPTS